MNLKYTHKYDDILKLDYIKSKKHPHMSLYARSAQFAPFAALTGYEDAVKETGRETIEKIEIDENLKNILDMKLQLLQEYIGKKIEVSFTYFEKDAYKSGGKYITHIGILKKIDSLNQTIILADKKEILIEDLIDISGEVFNFGAQIQS